jgi:hypothetical protein
LHRHRRDQVVTGEPERQRRPRDVVDVEVGHRRGDHLPGAIEHRVMHECEVRAVGERAHELAIGLARREPREQIGTPRGGTLDGCVASPRRDRRVIATE